MSKAIAIGLIALVLIVSGMYLSGQKITGMNIVELNNTVKQCPTTCDDHNTCTQDSCNVNTNYECVNKYVCTEPKCSDDTPFGFCSEDGLFCDTGTLIEKCTACDCSDQDSFCNDNPMSTSYNKCINATCIDDSGCDDHKENTKDTCVNPYSIFSNGSSGSECSHELRAEGGLKLAIVELNQPNLTYGKTIHYCKTDEGCFVVQEADWNRIKETRCGADLSLCNYTQSYDYISVLNSDTRKETFDYSCFMDGKCTHYSFYYLNDWFEREADSYGARFWTTIDILGPFNTTFVPTRRMASENCKVLDSYFENEANKQNLTLSDYDLIAYVYFTNSATGPAFVSCNSTNVYVSQSGVDVGIAGDNLENILTKVANGVIHRVGGTDTSDKSIEGYTISVNDAERIGWY